jgi:hypothetical protein
LRCRDQAHIEELTKFRCPLSEKQDFFYILCIHEPEKNKNMPVALIVWHMIAAFLTIYAIYILIQGDLVTSKTLRTLIDVGPSDQANANVGLQYQTLGTARTRQSDILLTPNNTQQCGSIVWTLDKPMGRDWVMTLNHRIGVNAGQANPGDTMYVLVYRRSSETGCKYAPGRAVGDDSGYCIAFEVAKQQVTLYHDNIPLKSGSLAFVLNASEPITVPA